MKEEPKLFKFRSILFFCLSLNFPLQVMYITGLSIFEIKLASSYLTDLNVLLMINFVCIGIDFLGFLLFIQSKQFRALADSKFQWGELLKE
jgi:hypothetical protein